MEDCKLEGLERNGVPHGKNTCICENGENTMEYEAKYLHGR